MNWAQKWKLNTLLKRVEKMSLYEAKSKKYYIKSKEWKKQAINELNKELKKLSTEDFVIWSVKKGYLEK